MSFAPIHFTRVAFEQLWKPRLWRSLLVKGVRSPLRSPLFSLEAFHAKLRPRLLLDTETTTGHATLLQTLAQRDFFLRQAEAAEAHTFILLGASVSSTPTNGLQWHTDFQSGFAWEAYKNKPSQDIELIESKDGSDVKYPWELSRFQWLAWLGMAFLLCDETDTASRERWYQVFERDVSNWIDENPLGCGINWTVSMEVALRAVSWIQAYTIFYPATKHRSVFWQKFLDTLWLHGAFISYNLEYTRHPGNHFDANALGLLALGSFFYDVKNGKSWFHAGKRALDREIFRQTTSDGVNWEKSTAYHRLVTEIFFAASVIADKTGKPFSSFYKGRLEKMYEYMALYCRPDGSAPQFGDADDGRVVRPSAHENFTNHASNLVCGALYFQRPDFLPPAARTIPSPALLDAWMWFGTESVERWRQLQSLHSDEEVPLGQSTFQYLQEGGYVTCRAVTGVADHPVQAHFIADVGNYGMNGWGGHGHNDCFSFELWLGTKSEEECANESVHHSGNKFGRGLQGRAFVVDSGTGVYTSNPTLRNQLRSVEAHNTLVLTLNDITVEPVEFAGLWRIQTDNLRPDVESYSEDKHHDEQEIEELVGSLKHIEAVHHGYEARFGVRHQRSFELEVTKEWGKLEITDALLLTRDEPRKLFAQGELQAYIHLHIPPDLGIELVDAYTILLRSDDVECTIHTSQELFVERCLYSPSYGVVQSGLRIRCACFLQVPTVTSLQWRYLPPHERPQEN